MGIVAAYGWGLGARMDGQWITLFTQMALLESRDGILEMRGLRVQESLQTTRLRWGQCATACCSYCSALAHLADVVACMLRLDAVYEH